MWVMLSICLLFFWSSYFNTLDSLSFSSSCSLSCWILFICWSKSSVIYASSPSNFITFSLYLSFDLFYSFNYACLLTCCLSMFYTSLLSWFSVCNFAGDIYLTNFDEAWRFCSIFLEGDRDIWQVRDWIVCCRLLFSLWSSYSFYLRSLFVFYSCSIFRLDSSFLCLYS